MGKNVKYIGITGYDSEYDMDELSKYARKGWELADLSRGGLCYKLVKSQPEEAIFEADYFKGDEAEYLAIMEAAGWKKVLNADGYYLFKAKPGTPPIHSENISRIEQWDMQKQYYFKVWWQLLLTVYSIVVIVIPLAFAATGLPHTEWLSTVIAEWQIFSVLGISIFLLITLIGWLPYYYKAWKLKKGHRHG